MWFFYHNQPHIIRVHGKDSVNEFKITLAELSDYIYYDILKKKEKNDYYDDLDDLYNQIDEIVADIIYDNNNLSLEFEQFLIEKFQVKSPINEKMMKIIMDGLKSNEINIIEIFPEKQKVIVNKYYEDYIR